jgi:hypothetical protein
LLALGVLLGLTTTMTGFESCQPVPIEASDELSNGIAAPAPGDPRGVGKALSVGHRKECLRACHKGSWFSLGATQVLKLMVFLVGEGA